MAVVVASALATACSAPVVRTSRAPRPVPIATIIAPTALASLREPVIAETAPVAGTGPTIVIEHAHDPNRLATGATARVGATVENDLSRAGFRAASRDLDEMPTGEAFIVSPTVQTLLVATEGGSTTISCKVTLRVAPWSADDQRERWEPHTTATVTGEARATTSHARAQVELGIRDCLEGAVHAATSREVIPFLRRVASAESEFSRGE